MHEITATRHIGIQTRGWMRSCSGTLLGTFVFPKLCLSIPISSTISYQEMWTNLTCPFLAHLPLPHNSENFHICPLVLSMMNLLRMHWSYVLNRRNLNAAISTAAACSGIKTNNIRTCQSRTLHLQKSLAPT